MAVKAPSRVKRIDWSAVVFDLERTGMTQREIGMACGHEPHNARQWVNALKNIPGTQPKFHHGALLLGLWVEKTGQQAPDAPTED